jgi:hypothetical protein
VIIRSILDWLRYILAIFDLQFHNICGLSPRLRTVRTCFQELSYNSDSLPGYGQVTIKVYSDTSVDNMEQSTVNEYIFQENYQRSQNEQKLYMAW